jgi:RND superfamily putative drug exporter
VLIPPLEKVGEEHTVGLSAQDAPAMIAMRKIGSEFREFDSDSNAMVVLEGRQPLGDEAHHYYDGVVAALKADTAHVQHVADFWGDPLTASGAQSNDGKSAYVQVYLRGNQGETLANDSVAAVREIVAKSSPPPGIDVYVTGGAPLINDQHHAGDKSIAKVTSITLVVIAVMLVLVFRSVVTMILVLLMVFLELGAARGIVAFLAHFGIIGLSTFAVNLLTLMVIAAGTDYAIFAIGRYQEARGAGEGRDVAYYTMFRGTAHVVLGSGMTIAGAMLCLSFTRLPYFQTMGAVRGRHVRRRHRGADHGPGGDRARQPVRTFRTQTQYPVAGLASRRRCGGALARARPRPDVGAGARRIADVTGLQDQLRRAQVPSGRSAGQRRICRS